VSPDVFSSSVELNNERWVGQGFTEVF
jgi:hypothetical protein